MNKCADSYVLKLFDAAEPLAIIEKQLNKQRESMKFGEEKIIEYVETRVRGLKNGRRQLASVCSCSTLSF